MYYSCHCIKRNGLQHDCRRTGCGGEPACLHLPDPLCAPSQLARARGLADPAPLAAHLRPQGGGGGGGSSAQSGGGSGKKFIVCELKGITPDITTDKSGKCCKCRRAQIPPQGTGACCKCDSSKVQPHSKNGGKVGACVLTGGPIQKPTTMSGVAKTCLCDSGASSSTAQGTYVFDEKTINKILSSFDRKDNVTPDSNFDDDVVIGPGGRPRKVTKPVVKQPCTREGCMHWQPPPPCCWDAPCKADCFETPPGIRPGRNPLTGAGGGGGAAVASGGSGQVAETRGGQKPQKMILLTPECCAGCCAPSGGAATSGGGGPAAGMPVLVMKLC